MLRFTRPCIRLSLAAVFCLTVKAFPDGGAIGTGGGSEYRIDFVQNARWWIYPWLIKNGHKLDPHVDAHTFFMAIDPNRIIPIDHVFESCDPDGKDKDPQQRGAEVQACYNEVSDFTYISQTLYPLNAKPTRTGLSLIAHEVFRRMSKKVGVQYADNELQLTVQISFAGVFDDRKPVITPEFKGRLKRYCDRNIKKNCMVNPLPGNPFEP